MTEKVLWRLVGNQTYNHEVHAMLVSIQIMRMTHSCPCTPGLALMDCSNM